METEWIVKGASGHFSRAFSLLYPLPAPQGAPQASTGTSLFHNGLGSDEQ